MTGDRHIRIKLCEFETLEVSVEASFMGADAMGFHIFKHHDLREKLVRFGKIFPRLNSVVEKIVLTDLDNDDLKRVVDELQPEGIQYYPQTLPDHLARLRVELQGLRPNLKIWKVVSAQENEKYDSNQERFFRQFGPLVDIFLLDTNLKGGTGRTHDWKNARLFINVAPCPVFLAGGLTSENVQAAIRCCLPYGVDVETGISIRSVDGAWKKDLDKIKSFVGEVRAWETHV